MRVVIFPEPGQQGKFWDALPNDWHLAHHQLRDELEQLGFTIGVWPCDVDKTHDVGLCFDFPRYPCDIPGRAVCVTLEPPVVHPRQYDKINGLPFQRVVTFAREFCDDQRVFWEPYPLIKYEGNLSEQRDKYICAVSGGAKDFPSVNIKGRIFESLYNARRLAYLSMGKDLDLYGVGWENDHEMLNAVNYKGAIENKIKTMSQYKHAIVFENCTCEGYASEKQHDAHQAGVIPITRGWTPDYPWEYAYSQAWAKRIAQHVKAII